MSLALKFEPTGRKKRIERFFSARCSCGEALFCSSDEEPWGWIKRSEVLAFLTLHRQHGQAGIEVKVIEKD